VRHIARDLNAQFAVEGSVRRQGDDLRIVVNLVSAREGYTVWSRQYQRKEPQRGHFEHDLAEDAAAGFRSFLRAK